MTEPALAREYFRCFEETWTDSTPTSSVRFVVLDSETTGLDPRKDRIITIGAVVVENNEIRLDDSFEALLKVDVNTSAVTVHGITREESSRGLDEPEALEQFLPYLKDGVIVGHHIAHDVECFKRRLRTPLRVSAAKPQPGYHGADAASRAGRSLRRRRAHQSVQPGRSVRVIRSRPARPSYRAGGRLPDGTGLPAPVTSRHEARTHHARPGGPALRARRGLNQFPNPLRISFINLRNSKPGER